jgi:hypothetical protein
VRETGPQNRDRRRACRAHHRAGDTDGRGESTPGPHARSRRAQRTGYVGVATAEISLGGGYHVLPREIKKLSPRVNLRPGKYGGNSPAGSKAAKSPHSVRRARKHLVEPTFPENGRRARPTNASGLGAERCWSFLGVEKGRARKRPIFETQPSPFP